MSAFVSIAMLSCQNRGGRPLRVICWVAECSSTAFVIIMRFVSVPGILPSHPFCVSESLLTEFIFIIRISSTDHTKHGDRVTPSRSRCGNLHLLKREKSKSGCSRSRLSFSRFLHNGLIQQRPPTKQCQTKLERKREREGRPVTGVTGPSPDALTVYLPVRVDALNSPEGGCRHPGNHRVYGLRDRGVGVNWLLLFLGRR